MGTSNWPFAQFVKILRAFGIEMVIDVRRFATSKFPYFRKDTLCQALAEKNLGYYYLGKELGGFRQGGYEAYTQTLEYLVGLELLERMASRCRSVLICAERFPWRCHRRFIGRSLKERDWEVKHIIDEEKIWEERFNQEED